MILRREGGEKMGEGNLEQELVDFAVRVLQGNCTPQETAILPQILAMLQTVKGTASGN